MFREKKLNYVTVKIFTSYIYLNIMRTVILQLLTKKSEKKTFHHHNLGTWSRIGKMEQFTSVKNEAYDSQCI